MNECVNCGGQYDELVLNSLPMRKCTKCGLVWRRDFDTDTEYYKNEYTIFTSKEKRDDRFANAKSRINLFKKWADFNNFCDFGCGDGMFLHVLKKLGYNNLIGIEPEPKKSDLVDDIKIFDSKQDITVLFTDRKIQNIGLFHVIEHVGNPRSIIQNLYDALPSGGKLIIETPNIDSYLMRKTSFKNKLVYREHLYYFNAKTLHSIVTEIGFKMLASGQRNFQPQRGIIKRLPAFLVALLVHLLKREDYIWLVAVK